MDSNPKYTVIFWPLQQQYTVVRTWTRSSTISWTRIVRLQQFLAHLLPSLYPAVAYFCVAVRMQHTQPLFGKTCATTQKNVKSHVFFDFEKNVKKRKNVHSFTGHLITQPLILNYRKSVPVSHQHQTS